MAMSAVPRSDETSSDAPRSDAASGDVPITDHPSSSDPVVTNPEHYRVIFENDRVRVLDYSDVPGDRTAPHAHPDSVMITLSAFRRQLVSGDHQREVTMEPGTANWLPAQRHSGANIGETPTHVVFVELKGTGTTPVQTGAALGPTTATST